MGAHTMRSGSAGCVVTVGTFSVLMAMAGVLVLHFDDGSQTVTLEGAKHDVASMVQPQIDSMDVSMFAPSGSAKDAPTEDLLQTTAGRIKDEANPNNMHKNSVLLSKQKDKRH